MNEKQCLKIYVELPYGLPNVLFSLHFLCPHGQTGRYMPQWVSSRVAHTFARGIRSFRCREGVLMPEYDRYYRIEPLGKKWATVCYADGFKAMVCVSKNKRAAKRKGDDYLAGKRNARRRYVTAYGERINTMKSCIPRNARMISGGAPITHAQFAALFPSLYPPTTKEE